MSEQLQEIRVFISWSKERSRAMARALRDWLPNVLQRVKPWMSDEIDAGAKWATEIGMRLADYHIGILCVTPENQTEPWLIYEAGALSKAGQSRVCPLLFPGMKPTSLVPPLGLLNAKTADETGVLNLVLTMNGLLAPEAALSESKVATAVKRWWPDLRDALNAIAPEQDEPPNRSMDEKVDEILSLVRRGELRGLLGLSPGGRLCYWAATVSVDGEEFHVHRDTLGKPSAGDIVFFHPQRLAMLTAHVDAWMPAIVLPEGSIPALPFVR